MISIKKLHRNAKDIFEIIKKQGCHCIFCPPEGNGKGTCAGR